MSHRDNRFLIATAADASDSDDAAFAFLQLRFELEEGECAAVPVLYVYELQLSEPLRRVGLGSRLMAAAMQLCVACGLQRVMLTVLRNNEAAMRLYTHRLQYQPDVTHCEGADYVILCKLNDNVL